MKQILIATHNKGKYIEITEILRSLPFEYKNLGALNIQKDIEEHGDTFAKNAEIKARFFHKLSGMPTIADDSGIIVDALKKELGVYTRRWGAGSDASDEEWIRFFLQRMKNEPNKKASFVCNAAICIDDNIQIFEGITHGEILDEKKTYYLPGLPLSAVFKPEGCEHVYSALTSVEKNKISHRGKAFMQLGTWLSDNF